MAGFNVMDMLNKTSKEGIEEKPKARFRTKDIDIYNIYANEDNISDQIGIDEKAAEIKEPLIFAVGNAPTALVKLYELIQEKRLAPELIIGVPVGFVNVVQSKELILSLTDEDGEH